MEPKKEEKVDRESKDVEEPRRKPYRTPKLTKFGHVEEFTGTIPSPS